MQVERLVGRGAPRVPGQDAERLQAQVTRQRRTRGVEDLLEDAAQREHGRSGVDPGPVDRDLPQLAAGRCGTLEQRDAQTPIGQLQGGDEASDSGTYHGDLRGGGGCAHGGRSG